VAVAKFRDKIQNAVTSAKAKVQDFQVSSNLQKADLCSHDEAMELVDREFQKLFSRENWTEPSASQTEEEYKLQIQEVIERIWGEKYNPNQYVGSVAAVFNFLVIFLICRENLEVNSARFFKSLEWAVQEASMEDINTFFDTPIFERFPQTNNLQGLLYSYCEKHFPNQSTEQISENIQDKFLSFLNLEELGEESGVLYFSSGLRNSFIEAGSGPRANMLRYMEYYEPLFIDEPYLAPIFYLKSTLGYVKNELQEHWIFTPEYLFIFPDVNNRQGVQMVLREHVERIVFGFAMTGIVKDGVTTSSSYYLFLSLEDTDGSERLRYFYLDGDEHQARRAARKFVNDKVSIIGDYWEIEWSDEVIDDFKHFKTTTTTTYTTWTVPG
jgi:hypothetical protein